MGTDGLHHLLEGWSRDSIRFGQCSARTRTADPAENVLLDIEQDAATDALGIRWLSEGLADAHHGGECGPGTGAQADTEAVVYSKVHVHCNGEGL